MYAQGTRLVGRGGHHTPAHVVAHARVQARSTGGYRGASSIAPANDDRQPFQLRVSEQFDRRVEGVHIQVGNATPTSWSISVDRRHFPIAYQAGPPSRARTLPRRGAQDGNSGPAAQYRWAK